MVTNTTTNVDMSKFINVFHSLLFEEVADLEALSNNSKSSKTSRDKFYDVYSKLYPQFFASSDPLSLSDNDIFKKYMGKGQHETMGNNSLLNDTATDEFMKGLMTPLKMDKDPCHLITKDEMMNYQNIAFFFELVVQPTFICVGFIFNTIAINLLRR